MNLSSQLESLLFISSKPLSIKEIAELVGAKPKEVEDALNLTKALFEPLYKTVLKEVSK